jgi:hypothetical protein
MHHTVLRDFLKFCRAHIGIILILLLAAVIRLTYLGAVPHGFTWDEAAIGYNGYAIATTRRDEWLERLPVSFRSFGDYKAPLAIYLNGLFTVTLGLEQWVVRLPFDLSGIAAVAVLYWVLQMVFFDSQAKLTTTKSEAGSFSLNPQQLALLGAGALAFSPWHILYSRTGFESGIALLFVLLMVSAFFKAFQQVGSLSNAPKSQAQLVLAGTFARKILDHWSNSRVAFWLLNAAFFASLSLYTYHSAKIAVPLLAVAIVLFWQKAAVKSWKALLISGVLAAVLLIPLVNDAINGSGLERAGVTVFSRENSIISAVKTSALQLFTHFSPGFLLFGDTTTLRHGTGAWGVLLPTTFILILLALGDHLTRIITKRPTRHHFYFFFTWILIGLLPAAIATEVPHSNRSLLALPAFIGLAVLGIQALIDWANFAEKQLLAKSLSQHRNTLAKAAFGTLMCAHLLISVGFIHFYFTTYASQTAEDFYDGYLDALQYAKEYELGINGKPKVDQIYVTSAYGQPYIYSLFVRKTNPIWYQGGSLSERYTFFEEITDGDLARSNVLLVAGKDSPLDETQATHLVRGSDGEVRFKLYYLPKKLE